MRPILLKRALSRLCFGSSSPPMPPEAFDDTSLGHHSVSFTARLSPVDQANHQRRGPPSRSTWIWLLRETNDQHHPHARGRYKYIYITQFGNIVPSTPKFQRKHAKTSSPAGDHPLQPSYTVHPHLTHALRGTHPSHPPAQPGLARAAPFWSRGHAAQGKEPRASCGEGLRDVSGVCGANKIAPELQLTQSKPRWKRER